MENDPEVFEPHTITPYNCSLKEIGAAINDKKDFSLFSSALKITILRPPVSLIRIGRAFFAHNPTRPFPKCMGMPVTS